MNTVQGGGHAAEASPPWHHTLDGVTGRLTGLDGARRPAWSVVAWRLRDENGVWWTLRPVAGESDAVHVELGSEAGHRARLTIEHDGEGARVHVASDEAAWLAADLAAAPDEHYVGLGERFDDLDQRGKQVDLRVTNGALRDIVYKPIPFFMSSAGYGVRILSDLRTIVRLAVADEPDVVSVRVTGSAFGLRLYAGPSLATILGRYTGEVGRPAVPPAWVFGPWKSRDWNLEHQGTVTEDMRKQRELGLAATVKLIDANWEAETHDFAFDPAKYPDVEGMFTEASRLGYKIVLWVAPFMVREREPGPAYREADAHGYLIKDEAGTTYVHRLGNSPTYVGSCIDFTNPAAVAWWQGNVRRLMRIGVSGFKTDFGEQVPDDAVFFDGRRGFEMRNVYPRLYNRLTYEAMQDEADGVLLGRSAWDGSQALSAIWAGDQSSDFHVDAGLPGVVIAGQSAGLSGFPYWASDIGGYFGTPTDEVFRRWTQLGAFSPIMQVHGLGMREPWNFAPATLEDYRAHARWHLDLFPYRYTYAHEAARTGLPMMRALALEFADDPDVWGDLPESQYCLGRELLIAPMAHGGTQRQVYFPKGVAGWLDYHDGRRFAAGTTAAIEAPEGVIPVFVRAGAIVPLLAGAPDTLVRASDPRVAVAGPDLVVRIYPGADAAFPMYDGSTFLWDDAARALRIENGSATRSITPILVGAGTALPRSTTPAGRLEPADAAATDDAAPFRLPAGGEMTVAWRSQA